MLQVYIAHRARMNQICTEELVDDVQEHVASALSCGGEGNLQAKNISVEVRVAGPLDRLEHDVQITILAHDYRERRNNLDSRAQQIAESLRPHFSEEIKWNICVLLMPTSLSTIDMLHR